MVEKLNKVVHVERQLVQQLGREPLPEEIAAELECSAREVRDILRMAQQPVSLEKPIGEEEESELGDFVEDERRRVAVRAGLGEPPPRERAAGAGCATAARARGHRDALRPRRARARARWKRSARVQRHARADPRRSRTTLKKLEALPEAQRAPRRDLDAPEACSATRRLPKHQALRRFALRPLPHFASPRGMSERKKETGCKPVGYAWRRPLEPLLLLYRETPRHPRAFVVSGAVSPLLPAPDTMAPQ